MKFAGNVRKKIMITYLILMENWNADVRNVHATRIVNARMMTNGDC